MTAPYATPPTAVSGFGLPASDWNAKVRDSLENVAKPPRCRVNRTTAQSIGNAIVSNLLWVNEEYDTDNIWTPGGTADSFIVPQNGWYHVIFNYNFAINGTGGRYASILYNGSGIAADNNGGSAAWYIGGCVSCHYYMTTGSNVKAAVYQNSGVALNIDPVYPVNFQIAMIAR